MTLEALIEKLEAATEGSRYLDAAIVVACNLRPEWAREDDRPLYLHEEGRVSFGRHGPPVHAPAFTFSVDAALTLVPKGMSPGVGENVRTGIWTASMARLDEEDGLIVLEADAPTAPLALCIASLRASQEAS